MTLPATLRGFARWGLLGAAALVLALVLHSDGTGQAQERLPFSGEMAGPGLPSPDFNLVVTPGIPDSWCDTFQNDKECTVPPGAKFTVEVYLDSVAGLPDNNGNTVAGYRAYGVALHYSPGLERQDRANECESFPLLDFQSADLGYDTPGDNRRYNGGCWATEETTYTGLVMEVDFVCSPFNSRESITIVPGVRVSSPFDTGLLADDNITMVPEDGPAETLIINCESYFPWDVDGDNDVTGQDIFAVILHFGESKPLP